MTRKGRRGKSENYAETLPLIIDGGRSVVRMTRGKRKGRRGGRQGRSFGIRPKDGQGTHPILGPARNRKAANPSPVTLHLRSSTPSWRRTSPWEHNSTTAGRSWPAMRKWRNGTTLVGFCFSRETNLLRPRRSFRWAVMAVITDDPVGI